MPGLVMTAPNPDGRVEKYRCWVVGSPDGNRDGIASLLVMTVMSFAPPSGVRGDVSEEFLEF